jgi:uncharacterized protein
MKSKLSNCKGFQWDDGNSNKNWHLHRVTDSECEDVFFNQPLIIVADKQNSQLENRFFALGATEKNRWLFVSFTIRNELIRIISARDMTKSEQRKYDEKLTKNADF